MPVQKKLLLETLGRVGLDDEAELLLALGEMAGKWADFAQEIDGFGSVLELVQAIAAGTSDDKVAAAFATIGAEDVLATLKRSADRLASLLEELPHSLKKLLEPIGAYDEAQTQTRDSGVVRWPLLDKGIGAGGDAVADTATDRATYALSLDAKAALIFEAGDTWPYSDAVAGPLLRLRAEGGLTSKTSARLPYSLGAATASASGSATCALEYYFAPADPRTIYALALAQRVPRLVDPFDFDAVWNGFATSDLAGIHYGFEGGAKFDLAVSLADAGALGTALKAELAASVTIGVELTGKYFLTFRVAPGQAGGELRIVAALSRERSRSGDLGIKLGGTVDLGGLAKGVHRILAGALDKWDEVLREITPYLAPGTFLQSKAASLFDEEARTLIKNEALRDALVRDLRGTIGVGEPDESQLSAWLAGRLSGALDSAQGWAEDRAQAVTSLLDNLGRGLPALAQGEVRTLLSGTAEKLVGKAGEALKSKIDTLFASQAKALGKALNDVGVIADKRVADADAALAGVRKLIARYDALFRKVLAATEDAARTKISAVVQIEENRTQSATLEIEGTFLRRSEAARAIFEALVRGELAALIELLAGGEGGLDFEIDPERSQLKRYAARTGKYGAELVLFGFGASGSELLSGEAGVVVDGTGVVQVDAKGRLLKRFSGLDADREIELVSSYSLLRARALANAPAAAERSIGLAVTIGHIDESLKRHEVERFVGSLAAARLVPADALETAKTTFTRWTGNPGSNGKVGGALQLKLAFGRGELARLLDLAAIGALAEPRRRAIVRTAFDTLAGASATDRQAIAGSLAFLAKETDHKPLEDMLMDRNRTQRLLKVEVTGSHIRRIASEHEAFDDAMGLAHGMLEMIEQLRRIYFSTPETVGDDDPRTWSPKDYRDAQRNAVKAVRGWMQLNAVLFWTNSKVHPRTIAFFDTIGALGGIEIAQAVSLTMWRNDGGAAPETIVLSAARQ